jgi:hypothetical protein
VNTPPTTSDYKPFDPPNRYGWGFNPDKQTLTFFTPNSLRTYKAGPPACWFKSRDYPQWRGSFGAEDFQLCYLASVNQRYKVRFAVDLKAGYPVKRPGLKAMSRFYDCLDPDAAELARGLTHDSWRVYCNLVRAPAMRDLARDNLGLVVLMTQHRQRWRWRFRRVQRLAGRKRREIVGACGLPAEKQWVKLLTLMPVDALSFHNMHRLGVIAQHAPQLIERLRHLPRVTGGVLAMMNPSLAPHVHTVLLREIADDPFQHTRRLHHRCHAEGLLSDTIRVLGSLEERVPVFHSMDHLQHVHDDVVGRVVAQAPKRNRSFGPPPLPETEHIVALRSPAELRKEGDRQRNCLVAEYWADDCYRGGMYIYRITAPERASVAIEQGDDGGWRVHELKTRFNEDPAAATYRAVDKWLRDGRRALAGGWRPGEDDVPPPSDADYQPAIEDEADDAASLFGRDDWAAADLPAGWNRIGRQANAG